MTSVTTSATIAASEKESQVEKSTDPAPKIIDILTDDGLDSNKPLVSLEYFPPRSEEGVKNLYLRMQRMYDNLKPAFTDVTWGAGGSTADLSLQLALEAQSKGHVANLHLTCTNITSSDDVNKDNPKQAVKNVLKQAYDGGIRNIVALRGDPPAGQDEWKATENGFTCALDLVKFIRNECDDFGRELGVSVAGYPEGHPNAITLIDEEKLANLTHREKLRASSFDGKTYCCLEADYKKEMDYLKEKVDAGADFIITQMFFDTEVFVQFVHDCREWGIKCPVVPGIMCINTYAGFDKMTNFCKTRVPPTLHERLDKIKAEQDAVKQFGIDFGVEMCQQIIKANVTPVLHFYTLNLEKVVYGVLDGLGWYDEEKLSSKANENDAASQQAKGSAWARVGDEVKCSTGRGTVVELDNSTGDAVIELSDTKEKVSVKKADYEKVF